MVSVSIAAYLVVLAGTPGHLSWKASLYYYAAMFFVASVAWMFVKPGT
jgi:hypothetical protein